MQNFSKTKVGKRFIPKALLARAFVFAKRLPGIRNGFYRKSTPPSSPMALPKKIYVFWDTGIDSAPEIVKICITSWKEKNPRWELIVLDAASADDILPRKTLPEGVLTAHYADVLRTKIMCERGGVWVDATLLCLKPLDYWLLPIFQQTDFFAFSNPGPDRYISNWFLAAAPGAPMASKWYSLTRRFWIGRFVRYPHYYWHHYLFELLVRTSRTFRRHYGAMPRISAERCHLLQRHLTTEKPELYPIEAVAHTFVQKLTYKKGIEANTITTLLNTRLKNTSLDAESGT